MRNRLFWLLLAVSYGAFAQNLPQSEQIRQATRLVELQQSAEQLGKLYRTNQEKALRLAHRHHWLIQKTYSNGRSIVLQGLDERGEPIYYTTENNSIAAFTTRTNQLYSAGSLGLNLSGGSATVSGKLGIWDDGTPRTSHRELSGRVTQMDGANSVKNHSTHVAGTMIATGLNPSAKGMAFESQLKSWNFSNDLAEMAGAAASLLVSNHSYGTLSGWDLDTDLPGTDNNAKWRWYGDANVHPSEDYKFGFYGEQTRQWDQVAFNAPYYLPVKSAGNNRGNNGPTPGTPYRLGGGANASTEPRNSQDGYDLIATTGTAKNVLTVGAVYPLATEYRSPADVRISGFSSWGPTDDGRIKPDIVGDGVGLLSSTSTNDQSYAALSGTSMATPNVSGSLLLLQELHAQRNSGRLMKAATLKGLVLHTAEEAGAYPGPDYVYGWGLLNAEKAARVIINTDNNHWLAEKQLAQGETFSLTVTASGKGPLVATICWTDPEGTALTATAANLNNRSPRLVNDLDLRVSDGEDQYLPWALDPNQPEKAATRGDNLRDNVEQVLIPNTVAGKSYSIKVSHKGTLQKGPQAYSLIVSGTGGSTYCASAASSSTGVRIDRFSFGGQKPGNIQHTAPAGCTTYSDNTHLIAEVGIDQETSIPISVGLGTCSSHTDKVVKVFIDWNGDQDFNDAQELVATSQVISGAGTFNAQVKVPAGLPIDYTTRLRIVCVATTDPQQVKPCGSYANGETQDYGLLFIRRNHDIGVTGLIFPEAGLCANAQQKATVLVKNFGTAAQASFPVSVQIKDEQGNIRTLQSTFGGNLAPFEETTVTLNGTFAVDAGKTYTFTCQTQLPNDLKPSNDASVFSRTVSEPNATPIATATRCGTAPVTLKGTGNGNLFWYDAATGGNLLAVGSPASTTNLPPNETYFAALNDFRGSLGVTGKNAFPSGGYNQFSPAVLFTTRIPLVIESARLYIGHSGRLIVSVQKLDGSLVSTAVLDVAATRNPELAGSAPDDPSDPGAIFDLNLNVPDPGDYQLAVAYEKGATLFRNNDIPQAGYPFEIPGIMSITGNTATATGDVSAINYYYYFYDLRIKSTGCPSSRAAVSLVTDQALDATITAAGKTVLCNGDLIQLQVSTGANQTYQWKKNGLNIPNATSATYWAGETGNYSVEVARDNCLATSNSISVTAYQKPVVSLDQSTLRSSHPDGNQWLLNGVPIPGANQTTYTATRTGRYSVRTSLSGCPSLTSDEVQVVITSTDPASGNPYYMVYPNPATDRVTVEYRSYSTHEVITAVIFNAQGNLTATGTLQRELEGFTYTFSLAHLAPGLYLVRITDGQATYVKSVVKR